MITVPKAVEEWRSVVGWEGYYEVSSRGRVRRIRAGKGTRIPASQGGVRVLRVILGSHGYPQVSLSRDGRATKYPVHWLVAEAFIGPRVKTVDHIDGNRENNTAENLRYLTVAENNRAAGERNGYEPQRQALAKLTAAQVLEIRARFAAGVKQAELTRRFQISPAQIWRIVRNRRWAFLAEGNHSS